MVRVTLPTARATSIRARNFLDVQVDQGTDTVTVRAELPNPERVLVDGQFVSVRVERGRAEPVLVVPQASVQIDQAGPYVLVVGGDDKVEARAVTLGEPWMARRWWSRRASDAGEQVIVEGIQKVRPRHGGGGERSPPRRRAAAAQPRCRRRRRREGRAP